MRATRALRELRTPLLGETELVSRPRVPRETDSGIPGRDRNCHPPECVRHLLESMFASLSLTAITWLELATGSNRIAPSRPSYGIATAPPPLPAIDFGCLESRSIDSLASFADTPQLEDLFATGKSRETQGKYLPRGFQSDGKPRAVECQKAFWSLCRRRSMGKEGSSPGLNRLV